MRRFKLQLGEAQLVRIWLALTQFSGLDYARNSILAQTRKEDNEMLMEEFARVKAPEAAPYMLEFKLNALGSGPARKWLLEQVGNAIVGLVPDAAGRGKLAEAAVEYLRDAKKKGHEEIIRTALKGVAPDVAESVRKSVLDRTGRSICFSTRGARPQGARPR